MNTSAGYRRRLSLVSAALAAIGLLATSFAIGAPAVADTAPPNPSSPASPPTFGALALPTTQIDGVAWAQVVVGNTVYVAGKFTTARPAGSPAGANTVARGNLLAYNVTTGALISGFNIPLNAQSTAIAASPDGTRVYVGGDFTSAGGQARYRILAIDTATGQLVSNFHPIMSTRVRALAATNTAVYAGGDFTTVNSVARGHLAKFNSSDGSLVTNWGATADSLVWSIAVSPDGSKVYAGGMFKNVNGAAHRGLAMLSGSTGASMPFLADSVIKDGGTQSAITSLVATSDRIYGAGYAYGTEGNFEGSFSADPNTGQLLWMEDCHGDSYSVYPSANVLYVVGHPHFCGNVGGWTETSPRSYHHSIAFSKATTGTLSNDGNGGYANFRGQPSPTLLTWFPEWVIGSFTGQNQAAWSLAGNGNYMAVGGEFPSVNGMAQQGLTRFALDSVVKSTVAPQSNTELTPDAASTVAGQVRVDWMETFDQDNISLKYTLVRDGDTAHPVYQQNETNSFWARAPRSFTDTGLVPGSTHSYRLTVTDPEGNQVSRTGNSVKVASSTSTGAYGDAVRSAGASAYWRFAEPSGATSFDQIGTADMRAQSGVKRNLAGPVSGIPASSFNGVTNGWASTRISAPAPGTFSIEAWFQTTTTKGGKIVGFGNNISNGWLSSSYDRQIYMSNSGQLWFGSTSNRTLNTAGAYNNGAWHQVVASLGSNGMRLYVDGVLQASRTDATTAAAYSGFWRVGGDNLSGWSSAPASNFFAGNIGQVSVYPGVIAPTTVSGHFTAAGH